MIRQVSVAQRLRSGFFTHRSYPWIILIFSLTLTYWVYSAAEHYYDKRAQEIFQEKTSASLLHLQEHLQNYERILKSGVAFLEASDHVDHDGWHEFVKTLDFPEIKALSYTVIVAPEQVSGIETKMHTEGYPSFSITPEGKRSYYAPVLYIEPHNIKNDKVIGFDNASEPVRRKALEAARDSGNLSLSGGLKLVQQNVSDTNMSVLMFVPYYRSGQTINTLEKRRANIIGFVSAPFLLNDLLKTNIHEHAIFTFKIDDITPNASSATLFNSHLPSYTSQHRQTKEITIGGRVWRFNFSSTPAFDDALSSNNPIILAAGGVIFDITLFWILMTLVKRRQVLQLQNNTIEATTAHLKTILDSSNEGIHILNFDGELIEFSLSFAKMLGYTPDEISHMRVFDWDVELSEHEIRYKLTEILNSPKILETKHRRKNGTIFDVEIIAKPIVIDDQQLIYCSSRDITERKKHLDELYLSHQMIDASNDMAFMIRIDNGFIEYANATAQSMTGYTLQEMRSIGIDGFRRPLKNEAFLDHLQELKAMGRLTDYAIVIRKDGSEFPVEASLRAIRYHGIDYNIAMVRDITENEAYNQKIQKTTDLLKDAQRQTQLGSWQFDLKNNLLEWSDEVFRIFEIDPNTHSATYEGFLNAVHPEDREMVHTAYTTSLQDHTGYSIIHRLLMDDGRVKYVREQCEHYYNNAGEPIESRGTIHDISELVEHSAELNTIFDTSKDGIAITDFEMNFLDFNQSFLLISGYTPQELFSMSCLDLTPPEEADHAKKIVERLFAGEDIKNFEKTLVDKSGNRHSVNLSLAIMPDKKRLLANVKDVTKQKEKADELVQTYERLRLATDAADIGMWVWDISLNTIVWDEKMFKIYETPVELQHNPFTYQYWKDHVHPEDINQAEQELRDAIHNTAPFNTTFRILTPTGALKYIKATSVVKRNSKGDALMMVGINHDITTDKILEKALTEAKQAAENANRAKSDFLANMSHEIRTPLNGIIGLTDLVLQSQLQPLQRDYLTKAEMAAKALLGVINNILDYSKIEVNKLSLEKVPFRLQEIIDNLYALFGYKAEEKQIGLHIIVHPDVPAQLLGDPLRLMQVLGNLVGNALKFTNNGSVTITINAVNDEKCHNLRFEISDTGIGMTHEQQQNLFQPFYQADSSFTRKYGGTGLGLMITKDIINLMGGIISVTSTPNHGTTFTFTAEFDKLPDNMQLPSTQTHTDDDSNPINGSKEMDILLVEDNDLNQLVASERLKQMGLNVTIANNGLEAVELVKTHHYDAILMDLQMPVMDGFEATRTIRAMEGKESIPIIALSAAVMQQDRELAINAGMNEHIAKPIDKIQLREILSKWLNL